MQASFAQALNSSPYTRYGIGDISTPLNSAYFGNGGASVALGNVIGRYNHINLSNPATYGLVKRYNPIFNIDIGGKYSELKTETNSDKNTIAGLKNFSLLLPVSKKTGLVFGLSPFSTTGYSINTNQGDSITYRYDGKGSVNRAFIGLGQQIINKGDSVRLSVGANLNYLFGTLDKRRSVEFEDISFFNTKIVEKSIIRGFTYDAGVHYYQKLNDKWSYQFGATLNIGKSITGYRDLYAYTYSLSTNGVGEFPKDTVDQFTDTEGTFYVPRGTSFGLALTFDNRFVFSGQYEFRNWQNYKESFDGIETNPTELRQSSKAIIGLEYTPMNGTVHVNSSVLKLSTYRIGFHTGKTPYFIENTHLKEYGISFGVSIPLINSRTASSMNLGFDLGKMGTTENGLIEDNYFKFNLGFSLAPNSRFDRWFKKRLYN